MPKTVTRQRQYCDLDPGPSASESSTLTTRLPRAFWNNAIRPSVCPMAQLPISYRHAGCLQLSHRRPPEMCGLRTRQRTDVDPPRFLDRTAISGISSRSHRGDTFPVTRVSVTTILRADRGCSETGTVSAGLVLSARNPTRQFALEFVNWSSVRFSSCAVNKRQ